jgi:hypothetical protein
VDKFLVANDPYAGRQHPCSKVHNFVSQLVDLTELREDMLNFVLFALSPVLGVGMRLMNCIAPSMRVPEKTAWAVGLGTPAKCQSVICIVASMVENADTNRPSEM